MSKRTQWIAIAVGAVAVFALIYWSSTGPNTATRAVPASREQLHVAGGDGFANILVEETAETTAARTLLTIKNNGQTRFLIHNTNAVLPASGGYFFAHFDNGTFVIRPNGGGQGLFVDHLGNVVAEADLKINGALSHPSSRTLKEAFAPVDARAVLARLSELRVAEWSYKRDAERRRHVGPTAEDFAAAFGLGTDGKHIFPMDAQGITMAAVQGLHEKVLELERERTRWRAQGEALARRNAALEQRLARVEARLGARP